MTCNAAEHAGAPGLSLAQMLRNALIQENQLEFKRSGFTLIELVIVMAILTVVGSIALPRYTNSVSKHRVDAAARRIAADLSFTQRRARISSSTLKISFDPAHAKYTMSNEAGTRVGYDLRVVAEAGASGVVDLSAEPYVAIILSANFGDDAIIVFDGFGLPDSGGSVVVQVANHKKTITVDAEAGKPAVN